ncbi:trichothecene efflux pump [Fusarium coicis]|nr:trichothecene efflux pump [Fusarium coicis]
MAYNSLTALWPTIIRTLYTAYSIKVGWQSCVNGGGVVLGQAMSGLAIAYVSRLKIQCICAAALVMTFITSTLPFLLTGGEPQDTGIASGILGSILVPGGVIAQAVYVAILSNEFPRKIPKYAIRATTRSGLPTKFLPSLFEAINKGDCLDIPGLGQERKLRTLTLSDENIRFGIFLPPEAGINKAIIDSVGDAVVKAYTSSLPYVFYATIPFSCIMLAVAFVGPGIKKFLACNVAQRLQDKSFRKSSTGANEVEVQAMNECHPDEARVASYV